MATTLPPPSVSERKDGTQIVVSFKHNEQGQLVKVTQHIKEMPVDESVENAIAERKKWPKFGHATKPDNKTLTEVEDNVVLNLVSKTVKSKATAEPAAKQAAFTSIKCRNCGGPHFTARCPLGVKEVEKPAAVDTGKYRPPIIGRERYEEAAVRVSNLPLNTDERRLREVFSRAGEITRCHVVKDRTTGEGRGLAFISFRMLTEAERAVKMFRGKRVEHYVLQVDIEQK